MYKLNYLNGLIRLRPVAFDVFFAALKWDWSAKPDQRFNAKKMLNASTPKPSQLPYTF
jgi:hypothetical protein